MARCDVCGTICWGGPKAGGVQFCSDRCSESARLALVARSIPPEELTKCVAETHNGPCPRCNRGNRGPIDVRRSHRVVSFLVLTRWSSHQHLSCRRCASYSQVGDLMISLLFGWWGIPMGFVLTPLAIGRNLVGLIVGPARNGPSAELKRVVGLSIADAILRAYPEQCEQCGYNLTGNVSGACPECGHRFREEPNDAGSAASAPS